MLISFGYSFLGMGSGSGDIDPMTQQMLLSQMMGQEFDFQSLLLSMVVAEASSIEAGGPCMDLGDFMDLFPQGKCGSTKAGTLYQVMKIGVLGECNGRVNAARSKFTGCVTKAEGELASCQGGCPGKCVKPCPKIPVDCPPGCTAICELECQNSFRETMQECEEDQRTDYKDAADMYEDEMKELGNKANMIRMIALANGMAQGTFDDEFTCEEILGSCIPSTDKIVGFGSLLACQDQPGLIMQVLNSAQGGEFGAAFNGGFDQAEFDKIIEMGNRDSARILFRELDDKNFGALSAEQMARGAQYGHIDKDQAGKITADQMSPELYQTLSNNELINEVPENELNTYLSAGGKKKPDPGKGKPGKGSGGSSGQGGQQQTGGMNPMVQNMLLSGIMGGGGKNAPQRPERDKDIRHPVVVQGPGCEPCSFPPGFNGFENGCHKCVKEKKKEKMLNKRLIMLKKKQLLVQEMGGKLQQELSKR